MSSSQWIRVAAGFRLVASAAASRSTQEVSHAVGRVAQHGAELAVNARAGAAQALMEQQQQQDSSSAQMGKEKVTSSSFSQINGASSSDDVMSHSIRRPHLKVLREADADEIISAPDADKIISAPVNGAILGNYKNVDVKSTPQQKALSANEASISVSIDTNDDDTAARQHEQLPPPQEPLQHNATNQKDDDNSRLKQEHAVPSSRLGRAVGFAGLGVGLAFGTAAEATMRLFGSQPSKSDSVVATDANADRLAAALCRMRGAALKLGQMLSIQDETMLPPALARALKQVRQGAHAMPREQLLQQLTSQLGPNYTDHLQLDEAPFAAASIGQVHRATFQQGNIVLKVQYPGVADSIDADLNNLQTLISLTGLAPPGLFLENVIRVGRTELKQECDYTREAENQARFQKLVQEDAVLSRERFVVPSVIEKLTTSQVLASEYAPGGTIDKVAHLDQEERNRIAHSIMYLTMQELFVWRFMQTDPNWGNFLYDVGTGTTYLIDFGAAREYSKEFVDGYLRIVWAASNRDGDTIMDQSHKMGFLTGDENEIMGQAHKASGFTVGEPFLSHEPFDFRGSNISSRLSRETSVFMQHRLTPPPEEVYTLHRKLAGAYMLCIKLGAVINCREMLEEIMTNHVFEDDMAPPPVAYSEKFSSLNHA